VRDQVAHDSRVRLFSGVHALLGLWLIVSPFIVGAPGRSVATSGMAVGVLIVILAGVRLAYKRTATMSWGMVLLGAWTVMSPWVFDQHTGDARTWNYVIVGLIVAAMAAYSLTSSATQPNWRQRETGRR